MAIPESKTKSPMAHDRNTYCREMEFLPWLSVIGFRRTVVAQLEESR